MMPPYVERRKSLDRPSWRVHKAVKGQCLTGSICYIGLLLVWSMIATVVAGLVGCGTFGGQVRLHVLHSNGATSVSNP